MADSSKDELLLGEGIRRVRATSKYQAHSNYVPAIVSNIA